MLLHYLAKVRSSELWQIWHCTTSQAVNGCFHCTGSVATEQCWRQPCQLNLQDSGHRLAASLPVADAQHRWTEAEFAACLARHWPDDHWQCNWRVASSRICIGKRRIFRATVVTIFSHMIRNVPVFVKYDTIFRWFLCNLPQIWTSIFREVVRQQTEGIWKILHGFVGNLVLFLPVKEFWKSVKNWQSYRRKFGVA